MAKPPKKPKNEPEVDATRTPPADQPDAKKAAAPAEKPLSLDQRNIILATETLSGDLRDYILERLKFEKSPLPWDVRPEKEQQEVIERVTDFSTKIIERAVQMIASGGRRVMQGHLKKVLVKEALNAQVDFSKSDELRHELLDAVGDSVLVVFASSAEFMGARGSVKINPDQAGLDLDAERQADEPDFGNEADDADDAGDGGAEAEGNGDPAADQAKDQLPEQPEPNPEPNPEPDPGNDGPDEPGNLPPLQPYIPPKNLF